ncbi:MAG: class I SAM-dependent methyltransferase [Alphaproteobacteria bacterium]|nr:class I SAM-dependent methyltransferase [Alphaproteobacteria bacterium]
MQRTSQELMWDSAIDSVERSLPDLIHRTKFGNGPGTLRVSGAFEVPRYHTAADIHIQTGAYHTDNCSDDVAAGAIYDRALHVYAMGLLGPENDALAQLLMGYFAQHHGGHVPRRILDMGCAIGNCTVPWAPAFPQAEVYGIDIGAPYVRYAHGRAKSLGVPVSFSQQNAERTDFAEASFDLVVSHILLHETSHSALRNILKESYRLLSPGGTMLHLDIARTAHRPPLEGFLLEWEVWNNNEHFYGSLGDIDLEKAAIEAGFETQKVRLDSVRTGADGDKGPYGSGGYDWPILVATR